MTEYQPKSNISTAYDQWSQTYDQDANRTRELAAARLRNSQLQLTGRHVVEVGCGTGYNTQWLARHAASVQALDFSPGMLSKARARVTSETVQFVEHDLTQPWPLADASADLIVVLLVLEHIENLAFFFSESARVLRPGGDLYLSELHPTRQLAGRQAQFTNQETGELVRVTAFLHNLSEYIKGGFRTGFELIDVDEWSDSDACPTDLPRLMAVHFRLKNKETSNRHLP